ncbi:MAG: toxic anion resistance protein [Peptococcaceae bacterium]|nr:toxic anion resistance protein [Peptococcaceae bacterium]MBO5140941.1 toxic anion resistance protein [Peptococcaceae bacterium]MBO5429251.1 toxic anion resistance protein [Peptococcaceae bacterium]MBP3341256.1 toxic anion resistance protein [Peptococcaceae bacterium]MBP3625060.1 toxic anion resistance protein [Peptococcaceae bacterium]
MTNEMPTLTLTPELHVKSEEQAEVQSAEAQVEAVKKEMEQMVLTDAEQNMVAEFAKQIDVTNANQILMYGAGAQQNIANFSENALNNVRNKDLGEIGDALSGLVVELRTLDFDDSDEEKGFFAKLFRKGKNQLEELKAQYTEVEGNVDKITAVLEQHQIALLKDVAMLDEMYALNLQYYKELSMYIIAGRKRLEEVRANDVETLRQKAAASGNAEDAQAYNDLVNMCDRFEKKLHDLELSRTVSLQMGPQTRMLQNNDVMMVEKIQSSLVNTIPLWKSQMVLALGLENARRATEAQTAVSEMTNELLKRNADKLKQGSVEIAKEAERSIIDIETLQYTNEQLIATLDEVMQIQRDGAVKRKEAEAELRRIEGELKAKLMELK